jgi:hypothetical protein
MGTVSYGECGGLVRREGNDNRSSLSDEKTRTETTCGDHMSLFDEETMDDRMGRRATSDGERTGAGTGLLGAVSVIVYYRVPVQKNLLTYVPLRSRQQ